MSESRLPACRSGEDALALVAAAPVLPDVVLLDVSLASGMSGFEVCAALRCQYLPVELPIIMVTCHGAEEDVLRVRGRERRGGAGRGRPHCTAHMP